MLYTLVTGLLSSSFFMIIPHGLSINTPKKAIQKKTFSTESHVCKETPSQKFCPASELLSQNSGSVQQDILELQQESLKQVESLHHDKEFKDFQNQASQRGQSIVNDSSFQEWLTALQKKQFSSSGNIPSSPQGNSAKGDLYIFVSLSMGEKALLNLAQEAKQYGTTLVLRGFVGGSYAKTVRALQTIIQKAGQGVLIDPELFNLFAITTVPTVVLAKPFPLVKEEQTFTPLHDRLQGHVSVQYALESFTKGGDLKADAQALLQQASSEKEQRK